MFNLDNFKKTPSNNQLNTTEIMQVLLNVLKVKDKYSKREKDTSEKILFNFLRKECGALNISDRDLLEFCDVFSILTSEDIMDVVFQCYKKENNQSSAICSQVEKFLFDLKLPENFSVLVNRTEDFSGELFSLIEQFIAHDANITLVCEEALSFNIFKFVFKNLKQVKLLHTNVACSSFPASQKYDVIISNIYNYRPYDTGASVQRVEYEYVLNRLMSMLNPNTYNLFCGLPYSLISNKRSNTYRKYIVEALKVKSILFLEEDSTEKLSTIFHFGQCDESDILVLNKSFEEKRMPREQFNVLPNWCYKSFFKTDNDTSKNKMVNLKSCARILRGKNIGISELSDRSEKNPVSAFYVIGLSEFDEEGIKINFGNDRYLSSYNINPEFQLKKGDVLLSARGTVLKSVVFEDDFNFRCIPTSGIVVIRVDEDMLNPQFLECLLHTAPIKEKLNNLSRIAGKVSLTIEDIENFEIPLLEMDIQEKIASKYNLAKQKMIEAQKDLKECIHNFEKTL